MLLFLHSLTTSRLCWHLLIWDVGSLIYESYKSVGHNGVNPLSTDVGFQPNSDCIWAHQNRSQLLFHHRPRPSIQSLQPLCMWCSISPRFIWSLFCPNKNRIVGKGQAFFSSYQKDLAVQSGWPHSGSIFTIRTFSGLSRRQHLTGPSPFYH